MRLPAPDQKATVVRSMFARIADRYDLMNRLMTFGRDRSWQREVVRRAALPPGGRLVFFFCFYQIFFPARLFGCRGR